MHNLWLGMPAAHLLVGTSALPPADDSAVHSDAGCPMKRWLRPRGLAVTYVHDSAGQAKWRRRWGVQNASVQIMKPHRFGCMLPILPQVT